MTDQTDRYADLRRIHRNAAFASDIFALLAERDELAEDRDSIKKELDVMTRNRDALLVAWNMLRSENRELRRDKDLQCK